MGKFIGIDLGTTNSCVAYVQDKKPVVVPTKSGYRTMPSMVSLTDHGVVIGELAKRQCLTNPHQTIMSVKRLIGRDKNAKEVHMARSVYAFDIVDGPNQDVRVRIKGQDFTLEQITGFILGEIKHQAEDYLEDTVDGAVVTVPAYFNDAQRQATRDAGAIAGLNIIRIINEPTAAAIAYGFNRSQRRKLIAVYDLGGGTFDFSLLEIQEGVFRVIATSGDTFLGGDDVDFKLLNYVADKFQAQNNIDIREDVVAKQRLRAVCEQAKRDLSQYREVELSLPFLKVGNHEPVDFLLSLKRSELEVIVKDLMKSTLLICQDCLGAAGVSKSDLDDVLLVGGQTRMPFVADHVSNFFGRSASKQINPDEAVALGAAIQAHVLAVEPSSDMLLLDVTAKRLGVRSAGSVFSCVIEENTTVPFSVRKIFTTVQDRQSSVKIEVFQSGANALDEHDRLGELILGDIPPLPAGHPSVEVCFRIDADGILQVSAKDLETGHSRSVVIESSTLSDQDVKIMRQQNLNYEEQLRAYEEIESLIQIVNRDLEETRKAYQNHKGSLPLERQQRIERIFGQAPLAVAKREKGLLKQLAELLPKIKSECQTVGNKG